MGHYIVKNTRQVIKKNEKKRCCIASAGIRNRVKVLFSSGALMVQNRVNNIKILDFTVWGGGGRCDCRECMKNRGGGGGGGELV